MAPFSHPPVAAIRKGIGGSFVAAVVCLKHACPYDAVGLVDHSILRMLAAFRANNEPAAVITTTGYCMSE